MTLLAVVKDVCAAIGVEIPAAIVPGIASNRTMAEMLALANEMAQRIAFDHRDWSMFKKLATFTTAPYRAWPGTSGYQYYVGDKYYDTADNTHWVCTLLHSGPQATFAAERAANPSAWTPGEYPANFQVPADYKRMLLTSNIRRSTSPASVLSFVPDTDHWIERRLMQATSPHGEWTFVSNNTIQVSPSLRGAETLTFPYLEKNCIALYSTGFATGSDTFQNDGDQYRLDDRLLKLGMIWQWKALKGSPYAEDMSNYETALARVAGADSPAPVIIGRGIAVPVITPVVSGIV
jgi:hypothetical protein